MDEGAKVDGILTTMKIRNGSRQGTLCIRRQLDKKRGTVITKKLYEKVRQAEKQVDQWNYMECTNIREKQKGLGNAFTLLSNGYSWWQLKREESEASLILACIRPQMTLQKQL